MEYYKDNPWFALKQAYQVASNMVKISEEITAYSTKYGTDPKQIWKLVRQWIMQ